MYMQNTYLFTHVASQNYVYFRIQWFSMSNWSKIQWSFHDFLIFTNFKNFCEIQWFFHDLEGDLNFNDFWRAVGTLALCPKKSIMGYVITRWTCQLFINITGYPCTTASLLVHPCAKVMALFSKCKNFQILTSSIFLKIWRFKIEVLVSIYVKFHCNRP